MLEGNLIECTELPEIHIFKIGDIIHDFGTDMEHKDCLTVIEVGVAYGTERYVKFSAGLASHPIRQVGSYKSWDPRYRTSYNAPKPIGYTIKLKDK